MITRDLINTELEAAILSGRDPLNVVQRVFESLVARCNVEDVEDKAEMLNAILHYAYETLKTDELLGYQPFDLIMSRAFPTSETLRFIEEQEGHNIFE